VIALAAVVEVAANVDAGVATAGHPLAVHHAIPVLTELTHRASLLAASAVRRITGQIDAALSTFGLVLVAADRAASIAASGSVTT
jgi:hypothetical protein